MRGMLGLLIASTLSEADPIDAGRRRGRPEPHKAKPSLGADDAARMAKAEAKRERKRAKRRALEDK